MNRLTYDNEKYAKYTAASSKSFEEDIVTTVRNCLFLGAVRRFLYIL